MASSSSTVDGYGDYDYDVFLSFRGDDTRNSFTSHLYKSFCLNNIRAFIDNKIDRGDEIAPSLERVIEAVKLSVIMFSSDYASSAFCMEELAMIMQCKELKSQTVLPIFYKVDPSEMTYRKAFAQHEKTGLETKVERWKKAFLKALQLAGWHIDDNSVEAEIIEKITGEVQKKLNSCQLKGEELICTTIIGHAAEDNFKIIWECLMNEKISRVGVNGMGGVGKTTIATRINNQLLAAENYFNHIYWVTVSKDSSIYKLQSAIAKIINLDLSREDDERKRAAKLQKQLITKKFVLILDDVWEAFEIEDVGIPLLVGKGKLLLTTRSLRVCQMMKCQAVKIKNLLHHEALDLFMKESGHQMDDSREWRDIVHSVVGECAGLPLAIVLIGRRMRSVTEIWEWRNTLRELQKSCEGENHEMEEKVFKLLKFSYDRLPNDKYRQCFLYCSLFPEDHKFGRNELVEYWIGEGLINEADSRQAMMDKGNSILNELIYASLLECNKNFEGDKRIQMHDVMRDMARINAKVGLHSEDPLQSVHVINETNLKGFPNSAPNCSKLRTLLLRNQYYKMELPSSFFTTMQNLTVLDMFRMKKIPNSVTNLGNLKVLVIYECRYLKFIPYLGGLEKLQHLRISNTGMKEIPKGIDRLVNLKALDLSYNANLGRSIPTGFLEKLSDLQTLNLHETRVEVDLEVLTSLEKLEELRVEFHDLQKLDSYAKSSHWRNVDYRIYCGVRGYWKNNEMFLKRIRDVEEWRKGISLKANWNAKRLKGESSIFLPNDIQHLELEDCNISTFCVFQNTTFTDLRKILITDYGSSHLFTIDVARELLHHVQELHICFCNGLEEIIAAEEDQKNSMEHPTIELSKLKRLTLWNQPKLRSVYRGKMVCSSLELVQIEECEKLERLPFLKEKDRNGQNPTIQLEGVYMVSRRWWQQLRWDNPDAKSMYNLSCKCSSAISVFKCFNTFDFLLAFIVLFL